uniref:MHC class I-like antigen recognition-like domain-containing protein n=1 Tax=Salvator merianae TaxID=96440 RepID=A0A8D0B905_SALMN
MAAGTLVLTQPTLVATLTLMGFCEGSSSHSMKYFYTGVSEPGQGLPQFNAVGYVDGQLFSQYDSNTHEALPQVSWIKEVEKEYPNFWEQETQNFQGTEPVFKENINIAKNRYNQTGEVEASNNILL